MPFEDLPDISSLATGSLRRPYGSSEKPAGEDEAKIVSPVSAPLKWNGLRSDLDPRKFNIKTMR
jgi:hypothetical protein